MHTSISKQQQRWSKWSCSTVNRFKVVHHLSADKDMLHLLRRVATIAVTTAAVRTLMLPVVVYQMKNTAKMSVRLPSRM